MKNYKFFAVSICLVFLVPALIMAATYGDTTTYIGKLIAGDGQSATEAYFDFPEDMCITDDGNKYIADTYNHVIRKIDTNNTVSTVAGTGGYGDSVGPARDSEFALPSGVGCDNSGNLVVADTANNKIKKIKNGQVYSLAEDLNSPEAAEISGSYAYFLDTGNNKLKKVALGGGSVTTITSGLNEPKKMDIYGNYAYIANAGSNELIKVNLSNGNKTVIAGMGTSGNRTGKCSRTLFKNLWGVSVRNEKEIYVTDGTGSDADTEPTGRGTGFVVKVDTSGDCTTEVFADDANMVSLNFPNGADIYNDYLYVASTGIGVIYRYNLDDANDNEKFAGNSRFGEDGGSDAILGRPKNMIQHPIKKKYIYFTENNKIRRINTKNSKVKFITGNVVDNYASSDIKWYQGEKARFSDPRGMAFSKKGKYLYIADRNNNRIRVINTKSNSTGYLTGAGKINVVGEEDNGHKEGKACPGQFTNVGSKCAKFNRPAGLTIDKKKNVLYVADTDNQIIRKVYLKGKRRGKTRLIAGKSGQRGLVDGIKKNARFNTPFSLDINAKGTSLFVADRDNHAIRKVRIRDGKVTTLAGDGAAGYEDGLFENAKFSYPINLDWKKKKIYVSEVGGQMIRIMDLSTGVVKLVSGSGYKGFRNGDQNQAKFYNPNGIVAKNKYLFLADDQNDLIRKVYIEGEAPYTEPAPTVSNCTPTSLKYSDYPSGYAMIEVKGSNFRYGAKAFFGGYEVTTYVQSDSSLAVNVPIGQMAAGFYEVKIMNNDGQNYKLQRGFSAQEYSGNIPVVDYWTE